MVFLEDSHKVDDAQAALRISVRQHRRTKTDFNGFFCWWNALHTSLHSLNIIDNRQLHPLIAWIVVACAHSCASHGQQTTAPPASVCCRGGFYSPPILISYRTWSPAVHVTPPCASVSVGPDLYTGPPAFRPRTTSVSCWSAPTAASIKHLSNLDLLQSCPCPFTSCFPPITLNWSPSYLLFEGEHPPPPLLQVTSKRFVITT